MVDFPTVPFHDYGDVPGLTEIAIHHLPLQYKGSSSCIIELFCLMRCYLKAL